MFAYINEWMEKIAYYLVLVNAVLHIVPNPEYGRYLRFFTCVILVILMAVPLLSLFDAGISMESIFEDAQYQTYQEQLEKLEESAEYQENIEQFESAEAQYTTGNSDDDQEKLAETEEINNVASHGIRISGSGDINVEEIRVGR
jgi:stage III sporulation protein AF